MATLEFVDAYVHFWDLSNRDLYYSWLQRDARDPNLGEQLERLKNRNFLADDYVRETRLANVVAAVHVQAATGTRDPVKETRWLQEAAGRTGFPQAIVGYADLKDPRVEEVLLRHCEFPNLRGIRGASVSEDHYLADAAFQRGYALLEKFNLVSEVSVAWESMPEARDLALRFPNIPMALVHCGFPWKRTREYFQSWKKGIATLARAKNVVCKISGLPVGDHNWSVESIRPYVLSCIEAFGPKRCMFGSHWPVDTLFGSYRVLIDAYAEAIGLR